MKNVIAASDVVAGTLRMNNLKIHALFDLVAIYAFITSRIVANLGKEAKRVKKGFTIRTSLGDVVKTNNMYMDVKIGLDEYESVVDLIPLELNDFDVILGMD